MGILASRCAQLRSFFFGFVKMLKSELYGCAFCVMSLEEPLRFSFSRRNKLQPLTCRVYFAKARLERLLIFRETRRFCFSWVTLRSPFSHRPAAQVGFRLVPRSWAEKQRLESGASKRTLRTSVSECLERHDFSGSSGCFLQPSWHKLLVCVSGKLPCRVV